MSTEDTMRNHYRTAIQFARMSHAGQVDKSGADYFDNHLDPVVTIIREQLGGRYHDSIVGYLHDVLEDTPATAQDLMETFGGAITQDVLMLTKSDGTPYWKYIEDIAKHGSESARRVKRADLMDHINKSAAIPASLLKRYTTALEVLNEAEERHQTVAS